MSGRAALDRLLAAGFVLLLALGLGLGAAWTAVNLGEVPHYGDTNRYLTEARAGRVEQHRGFGYSAFLGAVDGLHAGPSFLHAIPYERTLWDGPPAPCAAAPALQLVQGIQLLLSALALAYFAAAVLDLGFLAGRFGRAGPCLGGALLVGVAWLDPLASHANLSVMTDSLSTSASLAFCAALADLGRRPARRALPALVLGVAFAVAAAVRIEKAAVLGAGALVAFAAWGLAARRSPAHGSPWRRVGLVVAVMATVAAPLVFLQTGLRGEEQRWSSKQTLLHYRVVLGNLEAVYDALPERARSVLSREQARLYDRSVVQPRRVMDAVVGSDARLLEALTGDLARTAWKERWPRILGDALGDTLENAVVTAPFYVRWAGWMLGGADLDAVARIEVVPFTYTRLAGHHPGISRLAVAVAGASFAVALCLAALGLRTGSPALPFRGSADFAVAWLPVAGCVLANALLFAALNLDLTRYFLFAHVAALLLLLRIALGFLLAGSRP